MSKRKIRRPGINKNELKRSIGDLEKLRETASTLTKENSLLNGEASKVLEELCSRMDSMESRLQATERKIKLLNFSMERVSLLEEELGYKNG